MRGIGFLRILVLTGLFLALIGCRDRDNGNPDDNGDNNGSQGNIYYVAIDGDDGNNGSKDAPWGTPGYASRQLKAGDALVIMGGTYILSRYDEDILAPPSGSASAWITIKGEDNNRPRLCGAGNLNHALTLSSYLIVENLEITSHNGAPFRDGLQQLDQPIGHVRLRKLYIHHIDEMGIDIADIDQLTVEDCDIIYTGFGSIGGPAGQSGGFRNIAVNRCHLSFNGHYYQGGPGPSPYDRPDGFGIELSAGPIEIKYSRAEHNRGDGLDSKSTNTYIHHCLVANNSCDGIKLWAGGSKVENCLIYGTGDGQGGDSPWAGIVISSETEGDAFTLVNVTLHDNPSRHSYPMYVQYDGQVQITVTMRNCIIANGYGAVYFGAQVNPVLEYNLFYRPGEDEQVEANGRLYTVADIESGLLGTGNTVADPLFIFPGWGSEGDYHVQWGSPAIDAGTAFEAPSIDLDGTPRPQGQGFDIGAYEKK